MMAEREAPAAGPSGAGSPATGGSDPTRAAWQSAHDHAWRFFELHANQRMTVFNFFLVLVGLLVAGIAATLQGSARFSALGIALGALLVPLSFLFWKLDQRVSFLIKHAERIQARTEAELMPEPVRILTSEPAQFAAEQEGKLWTRPITFGASFRTVFILTAAIGLVSASICWARYAGHISWETPAAVKK